MLKWYIYNTGTSQWDLAYDESQVIDDSTYKIVNVKLTGGYSHPYTLTWSMLAQQHTYPFAYKTGVLLVDTTYGSGNLLTPVFEGWVHEIQPADSNRVDYVAYDSSHRASQEITILSGPDSLPSVNPRLVYNVMIETDDDKAFERNNTRPVGGIIQDLLTDPSNQLLARFAKPPAETGLPAYVAADLSPLDMVLQEKITFESESLRSGLDRLLGYYPQYRCVFHPGISGGRRWRFRDVTAAPQVTLTINNYDADHKHLMQLDLQRSIEGRCSAVKIFGPRALANGYATVSGESSGWESSSSHHSMRFCQLTELWTGGQEAAFVSGGPGTPNTSRVSRYWQVADPVMRQISNKLLDAVLIPIAGGGPHDLGSISQITHNAALLATWDNGVTWRTITGWEFVDAANGVIRTLAHVYQGGEANEESSGTPRVLPDDVKLIFGWYSDPLWVRYPSGSSFAGTLYSVGNLSIEKKLYDESFAVGYQRGTPWTTTARRAEFTKLATNIHAAQSDIVYTGGCVVAGIDYEFLRLNRRINFAGEDASGNTVTTGWESINAVLTDVEYDYSEQLTSLTFSSDHMEFLASDPESLKRVLKIKAVEQPVEQPITITYTSFVRDLNTGKISDVRTIGKTIVQQGASLNERGSFDKNLRREYNLVGRDLRANPVTDDATADSDSRLARLQKLQDLDRKGPRR